MGEILNQGQALEFLRRKSRIVLTHGSFDLFHIGHLTFLAESAKLGGLFVVGVDSDEMMEHLKRRPVFSMNQRLNILSRFDFVDCVIPLDIGNRTDFDEYFCKMYEFLKPDTVTYGANFPFSDVLNKRCQLVGVKDRKVEHEYSHVSTSGYLDWILHTYGTGRLSREYLRRLLSK